MEHHYQFPAQLLLESVVTVGVGLFATRMAQDTVRWPALWGLGAIVASFAIHRMAALLTGLVDVDFVYAAPAVRLLGMALPFSGTIVVFLLAPIVLPAIVPHVPYTLRQRVEPREDAGRRHSHDQERTPARAGRPPCRQRVTPRRPLHRR